MNAITVGMLVLSLAAAPAGKTSAAVLEREAYTLDNGLRVVLHHDESVPLVSVRVLYEVGFVDDPPGQQGLVHLLEHTLFHGTEHVTDPAMQELYRMSASTFNGVTRPDTMQLFELVPPDSVKAALRLESDRMGFPLFDPPHVGREKVIVNREMAQRVQQGEWGLARHAVLSGLYANEHPMHPATDSSLSTISVPQLKRYAARFIVPNNAVLVLAGDLPDDTRDLVERYFSTLKRGPDSERAAQAPGSLEREVRVSISGPENSPPLAMIGWHSSHRGTRLDSAGRITASILRRRIRRSVATRGRTARGATKSFAAQSSGLSYGMFLLGAMGEAGSDAAALVAELEATLADLESHPPTTNELVAAKKRIAVQMLSQMGGLVMRSEVLAEGAAEGQENLVATILADMASVRSSDVVEFVRLTLRGQHGRVVLVQNPGVGS